jgi:hypothetical protein
VSQCPPALGQKIGEHNRKLVAYYLKVGGKLPTNAGVNGEFTHPINMANMLAAHLKAAGLPLTDEQLAEITKFGVEYDKRWETATSGYDETTFELQKLIDEGELKEWFKVEMLRVCTPEQRAVAVPPEIDGLVGLDIYSAGLLFQMSVADVRADDAESLKEQLKEQVKGLTGVDATVLESAAFLFNDWVLALQSQLTPRGEMQMNQYYTKELLQSARAQLKAYKDLHANYVQDQEVKDALRKSGQILYPRVRQP